MQHAYEHFYCFLAISLFWICFLLRRSDLVTECVLNICIKDPQTAVNIPLAEIWFNLTVHSRILYFDRRSLSRIRQYSVYLYKEFNIWIFFSFISINCIEQTFISTQQVQDYMTLAIFIGSGHFNFQNKHHSQIVINLVINNILNEKKLAFGACQFVDSINLSIYFCVGIYMHSVNKSRRVIILNWYLNMYVLPRKVWHASVKVCLNRWWHYKSMLVLCSK